MDKLDELLNQPLKSTIKHSSTGIHTTKRLGSKIGSSNVVKKAKSYIDSKRSNKNKE